MSGVETTALTVDFQNQAFLASSTIRLERSNKQSEDFNVSYFRVHGMNGHTLSSTSGSLSVESTGLRRFVSEFVYFNGENTAPLGYPGAVAVTIKPYGKFFSKTGGGLSGGGSGFLQSNNPGITFNAAKNVLQSDTALYGVCLVEYKTPYDLWRATFGGTCPSVESNDPPADTSIGSADDDKAYEGLDPMVIYAWRNGALEASLAMDPPECKYENQAHDYNAKAQMGSGDPKLAIEVDSEYPIRFIDNGGGSLEAGCKIRVYPSDASPVLAVSSGNLTSDIETITVAITEVVRFTNNSSARLRYQPQNSQISIAVIGSQFVDQWGSTFSPGLKKWGDSCKSVQWNSKHSYSNPISREVDRDEIVITSGLANVVNCYGAVEVTYVVSYTRRSFEFTYDPETKTFVPASIVAKAGTESTSISINGPSARGYG